MTGSQQSSVAVEAPAPDGPRRRLSQRLFPGDRGVWRWSLLVLIPALALIAGWMLVPRSFFTGSDSIGADSFVTSLAPQQRLCAIGVPLPADTGAIQLSYTAGGPYRLDATLLADGRVIARGSTGAAPPNPPHGATIPLSPGITASSPTRIGTICVRLASGKPLDIAGFPGVFNGMRTTLDGKTIPDAISIWMRPPQGQQRSLVDDWSAMMRRLTLFRPGFAGVVFYWMLFILGIPLLAYLGIRILAQARVLSPRRLALGLMVIAFLGAGAWAITTYAFDAPDESEHFAYTEVLAETGHAPSATPDAQPPYASDELLAQSTIHEFANNGQAGVRRPWLSIQEHVYEAKVARTHPADNDGGGESTATSPHSPLYYSLTIPGYELGRSSIFSELFWMRLTSALLAMFIAPIAFLTFRELVPSRPELAVAGGLLIGFQPMVSFISGAVNNDNGVNVLAALTVYLTVRLLRRGPTPITAGLLGVTLGLLPLMKGTGFALFPAVAIALLVLAARRRTWATLRSLTLTAAGFCVVIGIWALTAHHFGRNVLPLPGGVLNPSAGVAPAAAGVAHAASGASSTLHEIGAKLIYLIEVFIPKLPGFQRHFIPGLWPFHFIYIERGFAAFGWVATFFPVWIYTVITVVMGAAAVLGLWMTWRCWPAVRRHWPEVVFLLLVILGVIGGVEYSYYSATPRLAVLLPEQGRYAFTALVPLAGLALCGLMSVRRGAATVALTLVVAAMISLAVASHLLYLTANFT